MTTEQRIEARRFLSRFLGGMGAALVMDAIKMAAPPLPQEQIRVYRFADLFGVVVEVGVCDCGVVTVLVSEPNS